MAGKKKNKNKHCLLGQSRASTEEQKIKEQEGQRALTTGLCGEGKERLYVRRQKGLLPAGVSQGAGMS